jgi:hypothetical protein
MLALGFGGGARHFRKKSGEQFLHRSVKFTRLA